MDITEQLKQYEGTKLYQEKRGIFRNNKFYPYKDSLGYWTIGYGRLIKAGLYIEGITEAQADAFLEEDLAEARKGAVSLKLNLPTYSRWNDFLVLMVFQLGLTKTKEFHRFLAAMTNSNYATAVAEIRNSNWYRQTPNRVDSMFDYVLKG
ncbi:glycoside hydrolase family protein [Rouxiella sp. T17]|uniref:glycoside hydrolase family protein n=1 Tax=Rouxiella sp. T17 TaxID=3085684 RepID=UPI002FC61A08